MPYTRRSTRPRRRRRPTPWYRRKYSAMDAARVATQVVKKYVNTEQKHFKVNSGTLDNVTNFASGTYPLHCLSNMAQGTDDTERIGRQIKMTYCGVRGELNFNSAGSTSQQVRLMVFAQKQTEGDTPNPPDLFEGTTPWSFRDTETSTSVVQLFSRLYTLTSQRPSIPIKVDIKRDLKIKFNGTSNSIAHTGMNAIWLVMWSEDSIATPLTTFVTRLRYIDN